MKRIVITLAALALSASAALAGNNPPWPSSNPNSWPPGCYLPTQVHDYYSNCINAVRLCLVNNTGCQTAAALCRTADIVLKNASTCTEVYGAQAAAK